MKYRPEIDGLRAIAVIPVILFHAGISGFSGGFIGVDIFFVISGYLITSILIDDIEKGQFSLIGFYERRARRILPALFLVMLACIPFAWMWMLPSSLKDFSQSIIATNLFSSNILFWRESGYFDSIAEKKPLLHTWSLAVEEQYYIIFPLFLFFAWRRSEKHVFRITVAFALCSFLLSEWGWRNYTTANFFLSPTRAWELLAGSITAYHVRRCGIQSNNALSCLGLLGIFLGVILFSDSTPIPSVFALLPVVSVVLLVIYTDSKTWVGRLLSTQILVGVGLISYSAYLWHQPLFAFARIRSVEHPSGVVMLALSLLAIALAWLGWKYVEKPFRRRDVVSSKQVTYFSLVGILLFIFVGTLGGVFSKEVNSGKFNPYNRQISYGNYVRDNRILQEKSWGILRSISEDDDYSVERNAFDLETWFEDGSVRNRLLVVGNSHSKDIFNILYQSNTVRQIFDIARYGVQLYALVPKHEFWQSPNYRNATHIITATRYSNLDIDNLDYILKRISNDGKKLIVVNNIFEFPGQASEISLIDKVVYKSYSHELEVSKAVEAVNREYYKYYTDNRKNYSAEINKRLDRFAISNGVKILDRMEYICSEVEEMCYVVEDDLKKNMYDYGHHTLSGAKYYAKRVDSLRWFSIETNK